MTLIDADNLAHQKSTAWLNLSNSGVQEVVKWTVIENAKSYDAVLIPKKATNGNMVALILGDKLDHALKCHLKNHLGNEWWNAPFEKEDK